MIVVDTSALIAILLDEPEARRFARRILDDGAACIGAPTAFEFMMVAQGRHRQAASDSQALLTHVGLAIVAWLPAHLPIAQDAFARYGKGRGHPAQLNYGDCLSYALARALNVPLLYKGNDFLHTDIVAAL